MAEGQGSVVVHEDFAVAGGMDTTFVLKTTWSDNPVAWVGTFEP